jgi:hypothetical protein
MPILPPMTGNGKYIIIIINNNNNNDNDDNNNNNDNNNNIYSTKQKMVIFPGDGKHGIV